jgi:hypothetical protein
MDAKCGVSIVFQRADAGCADTVLAQSRTPPSTRPNRLIGAEASILRP